MYLKASAVVAHKNNKKTENDSHRKQDPLWSLTKTVQSQAYSPLRLSLLKAKGQNRNTEVVPLPSGATSVLKQTAIAHTQDFLLLHKCRH